MDELEITKAGITINEMCLRIGKAKKAKPSDQLEKDWENIMEAQIVFRTFEKEWRTLRARNAELEYTNTVLAAKNENLINGL